MLRPSSSIADTEEAAHLSLLLGRLLLASGADTAGVRSAVVRFAAAFGHEARLVVNYDALLLTLVADGPSYTRAELQVQAMGVDALAIESLMGIVTEAESGLLDAATARSRLEAVEPRRSAYPRWIVATALGLTAASLARLFGGGWPLFAEVFVAGTAGTAVRQEFERRRVNALANVFLVALISGVIGGIGIRLYPDAMPALCLIAPGMILVPGVPLINGLRDAIDNEMGLSLGRLASAVSAVMAIAFGLFAATVVTGVGIPVSGAAPPLPIPEDAIFSALAAMGFAFRFNVPLRRAWACVACGLCSHALRTILMQSGAGILSGTLAASIAAGVLARVLSRVLGPPPATFAFPGVVSMIPGSYAFRAVLGSVQIMHAASATPGALVAETISLVNYTILLTAAIAVGLAIPLAIPVRPIRSRH
ncbi:MAG TPA: threonine/serine exporter family protein [Candidatus Acidoferrales bacterium]|nr:threonine/serine exporter family protein [Candidatus Acidoferrales bacterium]